MIDIFDDADSVEGFDNAEYVDNTDAVPPLLTLHHSPNPLPLFHPTTTVSVLIQTSILPASRGY